MQDILIIEQVDVRRADDPDDSKEITINKVVFPQVKMKTSDHTPGGGVGSIKFVRPQIEAPEPAFSTKGLDLQVLSEIGFVPGAFDKWEFAATLRNTRLNTVVPVRFGIRGKIAEWNPGEFSPDDLLDCDHVIHEVNYMDLYIDNKEKLVWDFYGKKFRINGVDVRGPYSKALGNA